MSKKVKVRLFNKDEDLEEVINLKLRASDLEELSYTHTYKTPKEVLQESIRTSPKVYIIYTAKGIIGVFGVSGYETNRRGAIWLLATAELKDEHKFSFIKKSKVYLEMLTESFEMVGNWIPADDLLKIKWLFWLGFRIDDLLDFIDRNGKRRTFYWFSKYNKYKC